MDVKDLRSETVLNERNNDGNKYATTVTVPCNSNKLYQDMGPSSVGKVDNPPSRPCAVIGPDRVVPPPVSNDTLKKGAYEAWCAENVYRHPPEYPHKMSSFQTPIRNISPRQTFQENMQRIMVPPSYNSLRGNEDPNFQDKNVSHSKNIKPNIPLETKYCEVPYNLTNNEQKNSRSTELCVPSVNPVLTRTAPHGWPPHVRPPRPGALPASFGAPELYQYPEFTNCNGPRPVPINRPNRMHDESGHVYPDHYSHDGNIRFKPYPTSKERYPQTRYEYIGNYPNPFQTPPTFPQQKYDLQKSIPSPYAYPTVPLKYLDTRIVDPSMDGYQRPNPQNNFNLPFRNQIIHPAYGPVVGNCVQSKYPCPPDGSLKPVTSNKLPYDTNKMYVDYENVRTKTFPVPENFYYNEIPRTHHVKSQVMPNYAPVNVHGVPPYPYYRKENLPVKNYEFVPHYRNMDPSFIPMSRIPSQFSPSSIAISPSDSNGSNDASQIQSTSQEDCGYVSQSPTASLRSVDSAINRADFYRRYDPRYIHTLRMSMMSKPEQNLNNNLSSKDKKGIDVRQFLQMWNEVDDENGENSTKDVLPQLPTNDGNKVPKNQYEIQKNQDQLYVLGLVNVPNEELSKYEHIQKVSKLPENIKGYNNIELLKQFEEVIESSNVNNFSTKISTSRDIGYRSLKGSMTHQAPNLLQRPMSPLDVEAKISQSVIHKEVGCNFEIKPCSPKMLNVEVATSVQTVLGERVIEKVTNPLNMAPSLLHVEEKMNCNVMNPKDHRKSIKNLDVSSCKMINASYAANDLVRSNYSFQDLESNSGVCLASLPRLDNDIELNFPEVNQQFINANKGDSVITKTNELPALILEQSENLLIKDNEKYLNPRSEMNYEFSPSIIESEREFSKLSRFRKKKIESEVTEMDLSCTSSQNLRTDSVIIKNPENSKIIEFNKVVSPIEKLSECTDQISCSSSGKNDTCIKAMDPNIEVDLPMENAIDFSLKSDNTTASPLNKFLYVDANQTNKSKSNLPEDVKLYNIDNKTYSAASQTNTIIEKLNNNNTSLPENEKGDGGKLVELIKENVKESRMEVPKTTRESFRTTDSLFTEIDVHTPVKEPTHDKNEDKMLNNINNSTNEQHLKENKHDDNSQTGVNLDSIITPSLRDLNPTVDGRDKVMTPLVTNNEIKCDDVNIVISKCDSEDTLNVTLPYKNAKIHVQNNSISTQNDSDESDDWTQESDSDSKSSSTSTSIQEDTDSEDECTLNETVLMSVYHSPCHKQDNTECDKIVAENKAAESNVFFNTNVNNFLKRRKIVEKFNKELLSPRIQNLLTYSEGPTSSHLGKCINNNHNQSSSKDGNNKNIETTELLVISPSLNNYEKTNSFISDEYDSDIKRDSIKNDCNEEITAGIRESVELLKSLEVSHEEDKGTKSKNILHIEEDSCDNREESSEGNKNDQKHLGSINNFMKQHRQFLNNSNGLNNCIKSFCDKNIDNQVKCAEIAHDYVKHDTLNVLNLNYTENNFDENIDKHLKSLNNEIKQDTQLITNSNDSDNCIDGLCSNENIDDLVKCTEIVNDNIKSDDNLKQDTEDVFILNNIGSIFDENADRELKLAEISHCSMSKNSIDGNHSNYIHGHDENVCGKKSENKISYNNIKQNMEDAKHHEKYSENTFGARPDRPNYLDISCNDINLDDQYAKKTNLDCIETIEKIQCSNKNSNNEKLDTQNVNDTKNTKINVECEYLCDKRTLARMSHKEPEKKCLKDSMNKIEHNSFNYIKNSVDYISSDERNVKSIGILNDNIAEEALNLKHIQSAESYIDNISDKNAEVRLKTEMMLYDEKGNAEDKPATEELKSAKVLHDNQKENTGTLVLEEELKSAEVPHGVQKENAEEKPVLEEDFKSAEMHHDDQIENTEDKPVSEEFESAAMLHNEKENTGEKPVSEEFKSAEMLHDIQKVNTDEKPLSEEFKSAEILQNNREENTRTSVLEEELRSAKMLHDDQNKNTEENPVLEEEFKSAEMHYDDQKENTEEKHVSEEFKSAEMPDNNHKENTGTSVLEEELKSAKMLHDHQNDNTEEKPVLEEFKFAEVHYDNQKENTEKEPFSETTNDGKHSIENLKIDKIENYTKEDTLNLTFTISDRCSNNNFKEDKPVVEEFDDQPNGLVDNNDTIGVFTNPTIVNYRDCLKHDVKNIEILSGTNNIEPLTYLEPHVKESSVKKHRQLKRSLSDSALDSLNNDSSDNSNFNLECQVKRRKNNVRSFIQSQLFENNFCSIQNNRRNSVSAMYADEHVSFCILIDDNCIITEEDENSDEQEKICFAEISEDYLSDAQRSINEDSGSPTEILLCPQEETSQCSESVNMEFVKEKSFEQEDINQYSETEITDCFEEKSFEESWVEDIACVETVVSEDIAEDVIISSHSSPKELYSPDHEETEVFLNREHADKVKYIYGDKMCNDDAQFLETLYRTPQMNVNKTLISRESQMSDEFNQFYNKESLEQVLSQSNSCEDSHNELDAVSSDICLSHCAQIINTKDNKENFDIKNDSPIATKTLFSNDGSNEQKQEYSKLEKTQDDTVHSCESSTDNVFSYTQNNDYTIASSSEVSSTTSEEKNSSILLKITNYKGSRIVNDVGHEAKRISCKFTEVDHYSTSLFNVKTPNRPLITKAAQKYIPPIKETIADLKIRLPLPEHSLLKLKQLKLLKEEPKYNKYSQLSKKEIPKKPKPKFEDVLKSIDEIQFQKHKNNKKTKKSIPKVVIKKNENGAHYASTTKKDMFNPDLTGRKWQPWVFLEKNHFIDKMALKNKKIAVYNHRRNTYVFAEKFQKYKSCSAKFVISQSKLDDTSIGQLKCTIRLKHT